MAVIESYIDDIVDNPEDIKKMTREQLKAEIERLEKEAADKRKQLKHQSI